MPDLPTLQRRVDAAIDAARDDLRALSLDLHAHPELNFQEHYAHAALVAFLAARGFTVEPSVGGLATAFRARAGAGPPVVAFCCEYDALPEIGHACGHNLIAAAGVAAGLGLRAVLDSVPGTVLVLGTPAEEGGGGKIELLRAGVLAGIDAALMVHPATQDSAWPAISALQQLEVAFHGVAAHAAAYPWEGVNALDAMILAYNAIAALRQQLPPDARVHGVITRGGTKPNIIPDHTAAEFYVRAGTRASLAALTPRVLACFQGAAAATGCRLEHRWSGPPYSDLRTNDPLAAAYADHARALGVPVPPREAGGFAGSTDMGNVSYALPAIHPMFRIDATGGNHTPAFTAAAATPAAHAAMLTAARAMAATALDVLTSPDLRARMQAAFQAADSA